MLLLAFETNHTIHQSWADRHKKRAVGCLEWSAVLQRLLGLDVLRLNLLADRCESLTEAFLRCGHTPCLGNILGRSQCAPRLVIDFSYS